MTGASKILTVSYGTFSCTLEGFDDPFNTMKAIAEYFRDLAAEDRYFGAEPPTPDAAMLHRIAEREIQRRVEAKIQDNGVILRAGDREGADALPAPVVMAPSVLAEPPQTVTVSPAPVADAEAAAESVAARLQRIRARHAAQTAAEPGPTVVTTPVAAVVVEGTHTAAAPAPLATASLDDSYTEDEHAEALPLETAVAEPVIEISDHLESILDVAETDLAALAADPVPELPAVDLPQIDLSDDFSDLPEAEDFDPAPLAAVEVETLDNLDETAQNNDAVLASLVENLVETLAAAPTEPADEPAPFDAFDAETDDEVADNGMLDDASTPSTATETDESALLSRLSEIAAEVDAAQPDAAPEVIATTDQTAPTAAADEAPKPQRARARVIRIRRAEAPAAEAETPSPVAASTEEATAQSTTALSDEAEAALQAELAALEAEHGAEAPTTAEVEAPAPQPAAEREDDDIATDIEPRHHAPIPAEDDAVNRLIAQANSEMDGEETRRRQSAIAHLKAAAAATAADRSAQDSTTSENTRMEAYRDDLERAVRPRRPASGGSSTARPHSDADSVQRPSPLVLVSAQRIDRDLSDAAPRVVMPVRPRRVSAALTDANLMQDADQSNDDLDGLLSPDEAENLFADASSFQDFADQLGATALPDLLEAAAVYCAEVLQRPEFSRPLVMRQIAGLPGQTTTAREDYLRGFGTLLRQGRIAKVKRGMFALTDRSPYLAEARKQTG